MMISAHIFLVPVIFLSTSRNFYFLFLATFLLIIINFFLQTDAFPPTQHQQLSTNNSAPSQHHQLSQVSTKSAQQLSTNNSAPTQHHQLSTTTTPTQHQQLSTNNSAPTTQHQLRHPPILTPTHLTPCLKRLLYGLGSKRLLPFQRQGVDKMLHLFHLACLQVQTR